MTVQDLLDATQWQCLSNQTDLSKTIEGCFCSDLLSWVMGNGENSQAWITVQAHLNVIAVAVLCEFSCIILAHGAEIEEAVLAKANEENITIIRSDLSTFEVCRKCIELGL